MKMSDLFPSKWLKAEDLEEGATLALTIKDVVMEELGQGAKKETKPVVYFRDSDKGLVLNKTNGSIIAKMYGDNTDEWIGKTITLFTMEVDSFGDIVRAVRVKERKPAKSNGSGNAPAKTKEDFVLIVQQHGVNKDEANVVAGRHRRPDNTIDWDAAIAELHKRQDSPLFEKAA